MAAPTDSSLLSAELEEDDGDDGLRRLLLQVTQDEERPPRTAPSRAVTPKPGLCVKTWAGGSKVFINVCHSNEVPAPPPLTPPELQRLLSSPDVASFRIPMSLGEPHVEQDSSGHPCTAYDVVINSAFFRTLQAEPLYLEFFLTVAMEGLGEKYGVDLGHGERRLLRNRKFLGSIAAQRIRVRPRIHELQRPPDAPTPPQPFPPPSPPMPTPPPFVVVAEPSAQHPRVLQARVLLPHSTDAASLFVGLNEERLVVGGAAESMGRSGAVPPLLDLRLPHSADTERCRARFHRAARVLTVTIPLQV